MGARILAEDEVLRVFPEAVPLARTGARILAAAYPFSDLVRELWQQLAPKAEVLKVRYPKAVVTCALAVMPAEGGEAFVLDGLGTVWRAAWRDLGLRLQVSAGLEAVTVVGPEGEPLGRSVTFLAAALTLRHPLEAPYPRLAVRPTASWQPIIALEIQDSPPKATIASLTRLAPLLVTLAEPPAFRASPAWEKLSDPIQQQYAEALRKSNTRKAQAEAFGVSESTLYRWLRAERGFALRRGRPRKKTENS